MTSPRPLTPAGPTTPTVEALVARYNALNALKARIDVELVAVADGLRVAGVLPPRRGRPMIADRFTEEEARELHRRHRAGEDSEEIRAGERQYQRQHKRRRRAEKAQA